MFFIYAIFPSFYIGPPQSFTLAKMEKWDEQIGMNRFCENNKKYLTSWILRPPSLRFLSVLILPILRSIRLTVLFFFLLSPQTVGSSVFCISQFSYSHTPKSLASEGWDAPLKESSLLSDPFSECYMSQMSINRLISDIPQCVNSIANAYIFLSL